MKEAIEDFDKRATTVTTRSINHPYEAPAMTICSNPPFKPSISKLYNLTIPIRDLFYLPTNTTKRLYDQIFINESMKSLYEKFSYSEDLQFVFWMDKLTLGINQVKYLKNVTIEVELKKVPTIGLGLCHLIQFKSFGDWNQKEALIAIEYKENLKKSDIPKSFTVYFTPRNEWHGIVTEYWTGRNQPLKIDTASYHLPLEIEVNRLSQNEYHPLLQKNQNETESDNCFNSKDIEIVQNSNNCSKSCIPVIYDSMFNLSKIDECSYYEDYFCAMNEVRNHILSQQESCLKPSVEKYFSGMMIYREGISHDYLQYIDENRKSRVLLLCWWEFDSKKAIVNEEKLVYDSKDLLAWLGGAFGIFVGYSFFDFCIQILDAIFHCIVRAYNLQGIK